MENPETRLFYFSQEDHDRAQHAAAALTVHWLEQQLPLPLPMLKPGLANAFVLVLFRRYGLMPALEIAFLRLMGSQLLGGRFLSFGSLLSVGGTVGMLGVLWMLERFPKHGLSWLGISVLMAQGHLGGQLLLASVFLSPALIGSVIPTAFVFASIFAILTGLFAAWLFQDFPQSSP